jgi:hypothetical protein
VIAVLTCTALAILSWLILPTNPSYDPWSWIVWGRAVTDPHMSFVVNGGPSWKPLPMIFTTIYGLFGGAAPTLWVITARIGGLLGLWGAWRLTRRLAGDGWLGATAGVVAAAAIVLTGGHDQAWYYYFLHGTSEAVLVGSTAWALDRLLDGKHVQAYLLVVAGGLMRPEWWPFLLAYAIWLWWREPGFRRPAMVALLLGGLAIQPIGWFVPPWITTGHPFLAATHAHLYNGHLGSDVLHAIIVRGIRDQVLPALILAIVAVILSWVRTRDRTIPAIAAGIAAWWVVVIAETLKGYPGLERFYLPAATLICVLGGVGLALLARTIAERIPARSGVVAGAMVLALVALSIPFTTAQITVVRADESQASQGASLLSSLGRAVAAAGGRKAILPCRSSFVAINHSAQTVLAWKLGVDLQRVGTAMRAPGVNFVGPHAAAIGGPAAIDHRLTVRRTLATVGPWRVVRMTDPRLPTGCDGS